MLTPCIFFSDPAAAGPTIIFSRFPVTISHVMKSTMTPEAIEKAARADRDAQPLTEADLKRMKRTENIQLTRSTAAPRIASFLSKFSTRLASRSGNTSISVWMGISAATRRKSSPSRRVLLATLRRTRSP